VSPTIETRRVAFVCADGVSEASIINLKTALKNGNAAAFIVAPHLGFVATDQGGALPIDYSFFTSSSVLFDAVFIAAGSDNRELLGDAYLMDFISDAYRHCKPIGADGQGAAFLANTQFAAKITDSEDNGFVVSNKPADTKFAEQFITAMAQHRFWAREDQL
jgi:catalase